MNAPSGSAFNRAVNWICWMVIMAILGPAGTSHGAETILTLTGRAVQGGMLMGQVDPTASVTVDGRAVRVAEDGLFVFGIGRDDGPEVRIEVKLPDSDATEHRISVKKRKYKEQRISGLRPDRVSPGPKQLARIRKENAQARKARTIDDPRTDFAQPFIWPALGRITGVYGSRRILNGKPRRPHYGVDIAGPVGAPVRAPAGGRVTLAHPDMYFSGGTLILDHGHGVSSTFLHLSRIRVKVGDRVGQGDVIADIGATGRVTGPHLDWRINWFDRRLDPMVVAGPMPKK